MIEDCFKKISWSEDPFTLKIYPNLFIGYDEQINAINTHIKEHHKIALVLGPTGAGKTSLLKWLELNKHNGNKIFYLSKRQTSQKNLLTFSQKYFLQAF